MTNANTDRLVTLRRLIGIRRDIELLIRKLSNTDALREFVDEVDATVYEPTQRYEGSEDAEVVAERWGINLEPPPGTIPKWVREKLGRLLPSEVVE